MKENNEDQLFKCTIMYRCFDSKCLFRIILSTIIRHIKSMNILFITNDSLKYFSNMKKNMSKIKPNYHYEKLEIPFDLPEELENAIDTFLNHINYEYGMSEDCYRSEIHFWLKDLYGKISEEDYEKLKNYYVHGGIYKVEEK